MKWSNENYNGNDFVTEKEGIIWETEETCITTQV